MQNISRTPPLPFVTLIALMLFYTLHFSAQADANPILSRYKQTNLVSDDGTKIPAANIDINLKNAWGIAFNPNGFVWVANNGSGTSTLYDGNGTPSSTLPVVNVPPGKPTGIVFNSSNDFNVTPNNPARFIFATENGELAAWSPAVDLLNAKVVGGAIPDKDPIYKGLTLAANGKENFLYATDFRNAKVQVFDKTFQWVDSKKRLGCNFSDAKIPAGFAPFGIQNIQGVIFVTYAKQDEDKEDDVAGPRLGYVNIFDANGCLIRRFASGGPLNAPWGIAFAPANFGTHSGRLLIGNFGDGVINAFNLNDGNFRGPLRDPKEKKITIDGLWGLAFGNGLLDQPTNTLFFTAGPNDEDNGLYGKIDAVKSNSNSRFNEKEDDPD